MSANGHQPPQPPVADVYALVARVPMAPVVTIIQAPDRPGQQDVLLRLELPVGSFFLPMIPDLAHAIGKGLIAAARNAKLGLTIIGDPGSGE